MLFVTCETLFLKWPGKPRIFYHSSMLWTVFVRTDLFTGEVKWLERLFFEAFRKLIWVQISCSHWIMHLCLIIRKSARFWMHMVDLQRCLPSSFLHATCLDSLGVPSVYIAMYLQSDWSFLHKGGDHHGLWFKLTCWTSPLWFQPRPMESEIDISELGLENAQLVGKVLLSHA